jgi:DUF3099 family protein
VVDRTGRHNRRPEPALITDAPENPDRELRWREIRYLIMMTIRALCLVAGGILVTVRPPLLGLWLVLCVIGGVTLPWLAVILANDRRARPRALRSRPTPQPSTTPELIAPAPHRVIDADADLEEPPAPAHQP